MQVYLGGYSPNVEQATFNDEHLLSSSVSILACDCATYLRQDGRLLFAIKRRPDRGGVAVFNLETQEQVGEYLTPGASPAYLGLNRQKRLLYVANYHTGWLTVLHYNDAGQLKEVAACQHQGHSVRPEQQSAHPHFFDETPAGHLVSCDLGTDCLDFYQLNGHDLKHLATWQAPAGSGVRHAVFANGLLYVVCELASQLLVVAFDETNMCFKLLHSYSTVADSYHGHNGAAALRVSADGRFVYVSNRGEDTIAVFAIKKDGLQLIQRISTFGHFPRDFNWDSQQHIVVAANQESSNVTVYKRDPQIGLLIVLQKDVPAAKPTCVLFEENKR